MAELTFNLLLREAGLQLERVRLLRHETRREGRTPYQLWRDDRAAFERYQSFQLISARSYFTGDYWASFVVAPGGRTLFVGMYDVCLAGAPAPGVVDPLSGDVLDPDWVEVYETQPSAALSAYPGRLVVGWGPGTRSWRQIAARQNKPILELREAFAEPDFPGFQVFCVQLSELETMPQSWRAALSTTQGVYLLTCPRTREQYVGSATGVGGFLGRWTSYFGGGSGGNLGLKSREPSDYRVSILQLAGSADDRDAILGMEQSWKSKLQSVEMGLNRN